jgi:hypothetical protein
MRQSVLVSVVNSIHMDRISFVGLTVGQTYECRTHSHVDIIFLRRRRSWTEVFCSDINQDINQQKQNTVTHACTQYVPQVETIEHEPLYEFRKNERR